jgi:hypothetical protein
MDSGARRPPAASMRVRWRRAMFVETSPQKGKRQESSSFLKKRTKKLLFL